MDGKTHELVTVHRGIVNLSILQFKIIIINQDIKLGSIS